MHQFAILLQAFVAAAIFFVWGVRHSNPAEELRAEKLPKCKLPNWLRDVLAILKITGGVLLLVGINRPWAVIFGGLMVAALMGVAVLTHFRLKNSRLKMFLATLLLVCSLVTADITYQLNFSSDPDVKNTGGTW